MIFVKVNNEDTRTTAMKLPGSYEILVKVLVQSIEYQKSHLQSKYSSEFLRQSTWVQLPWNRLYSRQVKAIFRYNLCVPTSWTQDTNWTYIRHSEHIKDVFWTSFVRSIYVLCLMDRLRFNFMSLLNISRETSATNFYHQETDKIVEINICKILI